MMRSRLTRFIQYRADSYIARHMDDAWLTHRDHTRRVKLIMWFMRTIDPNQQYGDYGS